MKLVRSAKAEAVGAAVVVAMAAEVVGAVVKVVEAEDVEAVKDAEAAVVMEAVGAADEIVNPHLKIWFTFNGRGLFHARFFPSSRRVPSQFLFSSLPGNHGIQIRDLTQWQSAAARELSSLEFRALRSRRL